MARDRRVAAVHRRMIYRDQMITGDECGPNILTFVLWLRENPGKTQPRNLTDRGSNPGPLREWQQCCPKTTAVVRYNLYLPAIMLLKWTKVTYSAKFYSTCRVIQNKRAKIKQDIGVLHWTIWGREPGVHEASLMRYDSKLVYHITVYFLFTLTLYIFILLKY